MSDKPYAQLLDALDREAALQRETVAALDAQTAASRARDLAALEASAQALASLEVRSRDLAAERDAWLARCGATTARRALAAVAALPGAPAAAIRERGALLRELAEAASARARRLQPLLRELQIVYGAALASILHGFRDEASGALVHAEA